MLREDGDWSPVPGGASEAEAVADMAGESSQSHLNPLEGSTKDGGRPYAHGDRL